MKKIIILFMFFTIYTFPQNPPIGGELRIYFIDLPSIWDITVDIDALGTVWDDDHDITTDYNGGQESYDEKSTYSRHSSDFSWDDVGYEPVLSLGHYKITVTSDKYELGAYIEFDMRTSDLPDAASGGTIDVEFDYSYSSNEIRHRGESEVINGEDIKIWELKSFVDHDTTNLEPYAPVNLSSTSFFNRPKLTWERHSPPDDYIVNYKIYRKIDSGSIEYIGSTTNLYYVDYDVTVGSGSVAHYTVKAVNGNKSASSTIDVNISGFVKQTVSDDNGIINFNKLHQNYPNPFNPNTIINYSVKNDGFVKLRVYDILGKEVALLVDENLPAGEYQVEFNANNLESGVYFYEITAGDFRDVKKLLLLK
jgi:Secretion system C-terminal sorting domain